MWGTQAEYAALQPHDDQRIEVFMVLGPWNHGGWARGPGDSLGADFGKVSFGGAQTGEYYRKTIEAPFFEFYLKGKPGFDLKDTASFRTGENKWERYDVWPPADSAGFQACAALPRRERHTRASRPPIGDYARSRRRPMSPTPPTQFRTAHRPIQSTYGDGSKWRTWLVEDQRFVDGRKDLADSRRPCSTSDVTVTGDVIADLFAATTGTDADWIVKLIDVYPDDAPTAMAATS